MPEYKQVIIIRKDLNLPKGKMAAQAAHAAVESSHRADKDKSKSWRDQGQKKIAVYVNDQAQLHQIVQLAKDLDIATAIITDAGHTVVEPGTTTCAGIGPDIEDEIDKVTGDLQLV